MGGTRTALHQNLLCLPRNPVTPFFLQTNLPLPFLVSADPLVLPLQCPNPPASAILVPPFRTIDASFGLVADPFSLVPSPFDGKFTLVCGVELTK